MCDRGVIFGPPAMPSALDPTRPRDDRPPSKAELRGSLGTIKRELEQGGYYVAEAQRAVDRTVREKLAEQVSGKDFGARGGGSGDNTPLIQAAVNAGREVILPPVRYRLG